jgi:hypothetical protein
MTTLRVPVIARYFAAAEHDNLDALVDCFINDGDVTDEGRTWHGLAEIRRWREEVATAYEYTLQVLRSEPAGQEDGLECHDVWTHLEGNFPGGTVDLIYRFGLRNDRIARLEIVPTQAAR